MASGTVHKHFRLSGDKTRRAQRLLGARTQAEAIERALDELIAEHERRRIVERSHERFLRSGVTVFHLGFCGLVLGRQSGVLNPRQQLSLVDRLACAREHTDSTVAATANTVTAAATSSRFLPIPR